MSPLREDATATGFLARMGQFLLRHPFVFVPCVLYPITAAPSFGMSDTVILLDAMQRGQLGTYVNNHNLTNIVGWLFTLLPIGEPPYRANLASAVEGSAAVVLFYFVIVAHLRSRLTAAISATCLMVSHSMWWHSTIAECYALNAVFVILGTHLLLRLDETGDDRYLQGYLCLAGVALFNHAQMGILGLAGVFLLTLRCAALARSGRGQAALRLLASCCLWAVIGLLPYLLTFLKDARTLGFHVALHGASGDDFKQVMMAVDARRALEDLALFTFIQFPTPFVLMILAGVPIAARLLRERHAAWALALMFVVNTGFFAFYDTWDRFAFLLPSFIILAFCGAHGVDATRRLLERKPQAALRVAALAAMFVSVAWPPILYSRLSTWGKSPGRWQRWFGTESTVNTHDAGEYIANPNKRAYRDVDEYVALLFEKLPPGATYVDDDSRHYYAVRYRKLHDGKRRDLDLRLVNSWGFSNWGLEPARFAALLQQAYESDRDLFLVSMEHPFAGMLADVPVLFRQFPLDGKRWIYKVITRREMEGFAHNLHTAAPRFRQLTLAAQDGRESRLFEPNEPISATASFDPPEFPLPISFVWVSPSGAARKSAVVLAAPRATSAQARLETGTRLEPGTWRVQARVGDKTMSETEFTVGTATPLKRRNGQR